MDETQLSSCYGCDVASEYDFNHMQMYVVQLTCYHGGCWMHG